MEFCPSPTSVSALACYLDDFTDFLALFAGWGVVLIVFLTLVVMIVRQIIIGGWPKRIQRVTIELFIAFNLLIFRNIFLAYVIHRRDLSQPGRAVFWLVVFVLCWKYFYFVLWTTWIRPYLRETWNIVIKPRTIFWRKE